MTLLEQLAAGTAKSLADLARGNTRLGKLLQREGVKASPELQRVLALPRRSWETDPSFEELRVLLTEHLRKPEGTMQLKLAQTVALGDLYELGGAFCPMKMGTGKTLVHYLAPAVVSCERPVVLVPSNGLRDAVQEHYMKFEKHWRAPMLPVILTYKELGLDQNVGMLEAAAPDLLMADEGHLLTNRDAAVTRRVERWLATAAERGKPCKFMVLSGTLLEEKMMEQYHHLMRWALVERMPLPASLAETITWSRALDKKTPISAKMEVGALVALASPGEEVREGFDRRIYQSPGVVLTRDVDVAASLQIRVISERWQSWVWGTPREITDAIHRAWQGERPDGVKLEDDAIPQTIAELECGFYYKDLNTPPAEWVEAHKEWNQKVRLILDQRLPGIDSPLQVEIAAAQGKFGRLDAWDRWRQVRDMHHQNLVAVWLTYEVIDRAVELAKRLDDHVLIWTLFQAPGVVMRERHGLRYFQKDASDEQGHAEKAEGVVVCSVATCATGLNLQHRYHTSLVLPPAPGPELCEQLIGRTHREGQLADTVKVHCLAPTDFSRSKWRKLRENASGTTRLAIADWV